MRFSKSSLALLFALLIAGLGGLYLLFPQQVAQFGMALERSRAGLTHKTLVLPDMQIAYLEGGQGEPLVLIHGFGADKDNWTRIARHLTPQFHVYAIDLPGFGESSKPADWRYRIQDQVERVHAIVAALGIQRPHLGGSSMGGHISASYAARYPDEVASLWLNAPGGVFSSEPSEMALRIQAGEKIPLLARTREEFDQVFALMFVEPPFVPSAFKQILAERAAANYELHLRIFKDIRFDSLPLENLVNGLATPTRIVWGEQDRVLHVSGAKILAGLMPNASVLTLPATGHLPMVERREIVAEDDLSFRASLQ